jgi:hypothetical protein
MVTNLIPTSWRDTLAAVSSEIELHPFPTYPAVNPTPSFYSVLDVYGPFPSHSMMVGICSDGFPFMLGLDNPRSGSILIVGKNTLEKSQIIKTMCLSISLINNPEDVSLCVITNKPHQYAELMKYPNCQRIISPYERDAAELVIEYASIVEQRRSGRERGGSLILLIDDFQSINQMLGDFSVYLNLKSLVAIGPNFGVWPLISIEPGDIHSSRGQLLRSFGTYVFERAGNDSSNIQENGNTNPGDLIFEPNFNVIVGGRLFPISNLLV